MSGSGVTILRFISLWIIELGCTQETFLLNLDAKHANIHKSLSAQNRPKISFVARRWNFAKKESMLKMGF